MKKKAHVFVFLMFLTETCFAQTEWIIHPTPVLDVGSAGSWDLDQKRLMTPHYRLDKILESSDKVRSQNRALMKWEEESKYHSEVDGISADSVQVAWISRYTSASTEINDSPKDMVIDDSGNTYVTAWSGYDCCWSPCGGGDYITFKYNSSGELQWEIRYPGPTNIPSAIAVDKWGNVYVTGASSGISDYDYATIKYSSSGIEQWVSRYSGPSGLSDVACDLVVDTAGNVYVTGYSQDADSLTDCVTIKYNAVGVEQWVVRYDGVAGSSNIAFFIAIDDSSNAYIAGRSKSSGTQDFLIVKYNNAGVEQWETRYNGTGNSDDGATALAVDGVGNIFVAGWSYGSGTSLDYAIVKYNTMGVEQWTARYNGPGNDYDAPFDLYVDNAGSIYVTGVSWGSGTSEDIATVMYTSSGVQKWASRYNGSANANDWGSSLATYESGYVYVTGTSFDSGGADCITISYDSTGVEQWVALYGVNSYGDYATTIVSDKSENLYVAGMILGTNRDCVTIKYNRTGLQLWAERYDGPRASHDRAGALAFDNNGNVYVTGWSGIFCDTIYGVTVKYNNAGIEEWVSRFDDQGTTNHASAIDVDEVGNVYVTGSVTVKYNSAGAEQWIVHHDGPQNAIVTDAIGNVYVTGYGTGPSTTEDYTTSKFNSSGVQQWISFYDGPGNGEDHTTALAVDGSGNVYVTGLSWSSSAFYDYATIKYDSSGVEQWVARYNGPGNYWDKANALAIDDSGNVYVSGYSEGSGTENDYATIKYNSSGVQQWISRYNGPANYTDGAEALGVDNFGNVFVTGWSWGLPLSLDYATIKYDSSGVEQWVARRPGSGARSLAIDKSGNIYVAGESGGDYVTLKYNSLGVEQWVARYNGPGNIEDGATDIAVDLLDNVYVTGYVGIPGGWGQAMYTTIKYSQILTHVEQLGFPIAQNYSLSQNHPNPFNPSTKIKYSIPKSSQVTIKVFDVLGKEAAILVDEEKPIGTYEINWIAENLPSGVYFYRIQVGSFIQTKKMILMK